MSPELEHKLIEKYPDLFQDVNKSPRETLICFGAECGDGWFEILDNLCGYITHLQKSRTFFLSLKDGEFKDFHCPGVKFMQIKEKYGTLRVYWNFAEIENYEEIKSKLKSPEQLDEYINKYYDTVENAIEFCEYLSSITCEECGKPGKLYTGGWYITLCPEHAKERDYID
jgi:hypothetical protein